MSTGPDAHGFLRNQRVVIFGAGYVGGAVARACLAAGARVDALTRNPAKAAALEEHGIHTVIGDMAERDWHEALRVGDYDCVLNCVSSGGGGLAGYQRSYYAGMESLRAWAGADGEARAHLIYTGSTSVYAAAAGERVGEQSSLEEEAPLPRVLLATEQLVSTWPAAWTVLRLAGIYGPGRHHLVSQMRETGEVAGRPEVRLNLVHRDDIVRAILATWGHAEAAAGRIFNVADDGAAPKGEVVAWLAERLALPTPAFTGLPAGGRRRNTPDRVIANDAFKAATGWTPRYPTFREGYAAILGA